jgi:glycosyltransferase involved in cell wall biosynthesis
MRILKIIHGYPPTYNAGSEVYSRNICEWLAKRHEVLVFTREENPFAADHTLRYEKRGNVQLAIINKAREKDGYRHAATDLAVEQLIRQFQPDVAHIGHLNHLSMGIPETLKKWGIPVVFTLHDFWLMCPRGQFLQVNFGEKEFHRLCAGQENHKCARHCYNRFFSGQPETRTADENYWTDWIGCRMDAARQAAAAVDHFIAPSRHLQRRFVDEFGIHPSKIGYLDYGFPLERLRPVEPPKSVEPYIFGYIGTHIPAKGVDLLIHAFSQLQVSAILKIWGRPLGPATDTLRNMTAPLGQRVEFMGEYDNQGISEKVFRQVHAIVVPSIWEENSPLVIHEAQACQAPVITANVGGMAEYVSDGVNGLLFQHRDVTDLTAKMAYAAAQPETMRQLGKRGYLQHPAGEVPDLDRHCTALLHLYQRAIFDNKKQLKTDCS